MSRVERVREAVSGTITVEEVAKRAAQGWRLAAVEWEREVESEPPKQLLAEEVPYGLQVGSELRRLDDNPREKEALMTLMELIVEEGPYWKVAEEMNRRGFRMRDGSDWSPVAVFEMLPRLIEVGPRIFSTEEWQRRNRPVQEVTGPSVTK